MSEALPWHESACERVSRLRDEDRLPHALLVCGPEGWGETEFASWMAALLLELPERVTGADVKNVAHPDLRWVVPDGAVIKIDEIRAVATFAIGTRQAAPCKVAVIEQAHLLNDNAANALLKTLEEPPPGTYVILATCQRGRLLPTIVSRCQTIMLEADEALALSWLTARWDEQLVRDRMLEYGQAPLMVAQGLAAEEPSLLPMLDTLAGAQRPTHQVPDLLELDADRLTSRWYRCCVAALAGQIDTAWARDSEPRAMIQFVDELVRTRRQMLYSNSANHRLLLERLAVRWQRACRP